MITTNPLRRALLLLVSACSVAAPAHAQSFGRSKVQYDKLDFRVLPTPHFSVYFYPAESTVVADAARLAERWYERHSALLLHTFDDNPLIFYADAPDFQQSNVVEGRIGVGTGGITEGGRDRVIMPFTGIYADNDHVLGHELVHVFQYRIAQETNGGLRNIAQIPLWLIEGMAEYLSLGRYDPNTAMWLRDAVRRNDIPTLDQLTNDPRYFPYRYGQALWAYIGGRWGDPMVNQLFRAALEHGWNDGLEAALGISADTLSAQWHAALRAHYLPVAGRTSPDSIGRNIIAVQENGDQNVSPSVSPDGKYVAFFSSRGLFGIDLYLAETATGRVVRQLTSVTSDPHFDALSFINSAGSWSPDGRQLAVVVFADGDNEIDIINVADGSIARRIRPDGVGAIADPAWSPDGTSIAFSGQDGGLSDLFVFRLADNTTQRLTNDREAQLQPAWSPDGRTLAFVTDAGPATRFDLMQFGELRLATLDVATRAVTLLPQFTNGKAINPQFTADGSAIYFVADPDGISDIYRLSLASGAVARVTTSATGISGISGASPAISLATSTGALVFSVFDRGGFAIRALDTRSADMVVAQAPSVLTSNAEAQPRMLPAAGVLPPAVADNPDRRAGYVATALANPAVGLPPTLPSDTRPYRPRLRISSVGGASVGASIGGGLGTGLAGGVMFGFSDMLENRLLTAVVQANGSVKDVGGQLQYLDRTNRLNYGAIARHVSQLGVYGDYSNTTFTINGDEVPGTVVTRVLQRQYFEDVQGLLQYPLSSTRRIEFSAGAQRIAYGLEVDSLFVVGDQVLGQRRNNLSAPSALTFGTASLAFVGDYSFFGFTSPVAGGRYRVEVSPNIGSIDYGTVLADYRRYFFNSPFTLAVRGLHYGRYGGGASDPRLAPVYIGQNQLIRGYDANDFQTGDCTPSPSGSDGCPEYSRLNGSRIAVANVELRIPVLGTERLGLLNFPYLPLEVAPFADAGVAWTGDQTPSLRFDQRTTERVPVFSAGVTARANVLGYAVLEVFYAHPFQRPGRRGVWGFQLAPGW